MRNSKITTLNVSYLFCFMMMVLMIFPGLYRNTPNIIIGVVILGWLITAHIGVRKITITKPIMAATIYILYILIYKFIGYSEVIINKYFQLILFWVPIYVLTYYVRNGVNDKNKKLLDALLISYNISFISNIVIMVRDPLATLMYNRTGGEHYLLTNIGETPYSFVGSLLFVFSYYQIRKKNASKRWLYLCTIITSATMMALMQRTITLILSIIALVVYYYLKNTYRKRLGKKLVWSLLAIGALIFLYYEYNNIVSLVVPLIHNDRIADRLFEFGNMFFKGNTAIVNRSGEVRVEYFNYSIRTWLQNYRTFLFGIGYLDMRNVSNTYIIGGHSELFDSLARHGIIGTVLMFNAMIKAFMYMYKSIKIKDKYIFIVLLILFFAYAVISSYTDYPYIGVTAFFFIPLLLWDESMEGVIL